ncbi:MAG TPA: beta-L-arabinofuranosidase domain-containing protein, partial [Ruminiclostridium sp.]|nr:beta-L-arabinofuranosidase domain-containing protein [Ruminiclostridium sp.]
MLLKSKKFVSLALACILLLTFVISVQMPLSASASNVELLKQFDMEQVKITDPYYINAFDKEVAYLRSIDPNRLLVGFKKAAGLSTSYSYYGGWENNTQIQGHTMGHYLSALAQAYKNTKSDSTVNADLKSRIDSTISELQACQNKNGNGYLFATPVAQFDVIEGKASGSSWVPWYTMHKIMSGLIEVYKLEGNPTALTIASNLGNWIYKRVNAWDSATQARVLGVEYGGMNDCLYELYKLTGNSNHLAAAHKFDETSLFNTIAAGNNVLPGKHANTTIPKFIGALNRYRTLGTSEASYLTAAQQFFTIVLRDHTYVTGGNSQDEHFRAAGQLDAYRDNVNNETCNVHNMLKLARELFKVTGDVKYADYYENAFINEIMSSQNPETGMATYFKAMGTGYFKVFSSQFDHFWCCTGTGMENFTKLNDSLYFNNGTDLYVNMYLSSTLNWSERGLSLTQQANVPSSDTVTFTINDAPSTAVNIKFRSPSWIAAGKNVTIKVNGTDVNAAKVNGYVDVSRVWKTGDVIEVTLPAEVKVSRLTDSPNTVAFTYGPVVLSAGLGTASMTTQSHGAGVLKATKNVTIKDTININTAVTPSIDNWLGNIRNNLVRTPGKLEFALRNTDEDYNLKFTPQYQRYKDRYGIYFKLGTYTGTVPSDNLISNPDIESGNTTGWTVNGAGSLTASTAQKHTGTYSLLHSGRTGAWNGPIQNITNKLQDGNTYTCSGWVRLDNTASAPVVMTIRKTDDSGTSFTNVATATGSNSSWIQLTGKYTLSVTGTLTDLSIYFEGPDSGTNLYVDDVSVKESGKTTFYQDTAFGGASVAIKPGS